MCAWGCALGSVRMNINGYLDHQRPVVFKPGDSFFVAQNPEADNPLLEKEIADKIKRLLAQKGFSLTAKAKADYILAFGYSLIQEPPEMHFWLQHQPGRYEQLEVFKDDKGRSYWRTIYAPGRQVYVPQTKIAFTRALSLRVIEARVERASGEARVVWAADTHSRGTDKDLRTVINYLLIGTFEHFGQDTGRLVPQKVPRTDPRLELLGPE